MTGIAAFITARLDEEAAASPDMLWGETADDNDMDARRARVLREVAAKRKILAAHCDRPGHRCPLPVLAGAAGQLWTAEEGPCYTLRLLASIWSDHPDYDPA